MKIKAIIFDWAQTLFDSEKKDIYPDAEDTLIYCKEKGYKLYLVSLVSPITHATFEERGRQIVSSHLRKYFKEVFVVEGDKDLVLEKLVKKIKLPREEIMMVDDRVIRSIKYGNNHGHPTVWIKQGIYAHELPNKETGTPTYAINSLSELKKII